jgi:ubiquinone/menaquinone biosynthesis C-methylase UbiE
MNYVGKNFEKPTGIGGIIASKIMNIMNKKQYSTILDNIDIKPYNSILDVGFGNGHLFNAIFNKNIPIRVYGIDISEDMVNRALLKYNEYVNNNTLSVKLENIECTSFENNIFDRIYTINTMYFWQDPQKCLTEIKRILVHNGLFCNAFYTKEFLDKIIFTRSGFKKYYFNDVVNLTNESELVIVKTIEIIKNESYCLISQKR